MVLTKTTFGIFKIFKIEILTFFFSFSLTWDPMGANISQRYSYKSQPKVLKLVLNFPPNGAHKTTFGIFEILSLRFLIQFRPPDGERGYMSNVWNFGHLPSLMPKYGNFDNWPVSRKPLPVEQK